MSFELRKGNYFDLSLASKLRRRSSASDNLRAEKSFMNKKRPSSILLLYGRVENWSGQKSKRSPSSCFTSSSPKNRTSANNKKSLAETHQKVWHWTPSSFPSRGPIVINFASQQNLGEKLRYEFRCFPARFTQIPPKPPNEYGLIYALAVGSTISHIEERSRFNINTTFELCASAWLF